MDDRNTLAAAVALLYDSIPVGRRTTATDAARITLHQFVDSALPTLTAVKYFGCTLDEIPDDGQREEVRRYRERETGARFPNTYTSLAAETPGQRSLREVKTGPYLAGRLVGLGVSLADYLTTYRVAASCARYADKLASGGVPAGINAVGLLAGMVGRDIREHRTVLPDAYYEAYLDISTRLDDLGLTGYPAPWPPASPAAGEFVLGQHHQAAALRRRTRAVPARELDPPAGAIGLGLLVECLTACGREAEVTPDTPVQIGPEFGAQLDPSFVSGAAVSYLAGPGGDRPPRVVIEYRRS